MTNNSTTLYEIFRGQADQNSGNVAFIAGSKQLSFGEFIANVDRLAAGLNNHGIAKGDRVCILAQNSIEFVELWIAAAKIGAIFFPLNWRFSPEETQATLAYADPKMLIIEAEFTNHLDDAALSSELEVVYLNPENPKENTSFSSLYQDDGPTEFEVSPNDASTIILTAATEGLPRGAVLTHSNFISVCNVFIELLSFTSEDRSLIAFPLFHVSGLISALQCAILGGAGVIQHSFDPAEGAKMIDEHRITQIGTFPPMLDMLLAAKEQVGANWETLRACFGILNSPETVQSFLSATKAEYWTGFGQSETSGIVTLFNAMDKPGSAGQVVSALDMRIVNGQDEEMPVGESGEIVVKGALVFSGYWRDEDASNYASRNGWHHTGDVGKVDEEGYLYYLCRKPEKALIKSGGENIYPAEVEHVIKQLAEVAEVCVFGVPDEKWGEKVKAVIELKPETSLSAEQVIQAVVEKIASYKKPQVVEFTDSLPRLENGELDREAVTNSFA